MSILKQLLRDNELLAELKIASELTKNERMIKADQQFDSELSLKFYLFRLYGQIICTQEENEIFHFYMTKPGKKGDKLPPQAHKIFAGKVFDLYQV